MSDERSPRPLRRLRSAVWHELRGVARGYWTLLVFEVCVALVVGLRAHPSINRDFYVATCQILPVLLLSAMFRLGRTKTVSRAAVLIVVLPFAAGEAVALAVAGNRKQTITSSWLLATVVASLAAIAILMIVLALNQRPDERDDPTA